MTPKLEPPECVSGLRRAFTAFCVNLMPLVPLPIEWYRRILVNNSEARYRTNRWSYLGDLSEAHRYGIIAGYSDLFPPPRKRVLDVGCGEGILQQRLNYREYVGIDMNADAIRDATRRVAGTRADTVFHHTSAEEFRPQTEFDLIVFNESLYYMPAPVKIVERYIQFLSPDGIMIFCMFQTYLARLLWNEIAKLDLVEMAAVKVTNRFGFVSWIKAYAKPSLGSNA